MAVDVNLGMMLPEKTTCQSTKFAMEGNLEKKIPDT